jgi:hypothetical protein
VLHGRDWNAGLGDKPVGDKFGALFGAIIIYFINGDLNAGSVL